jgi:hypothetical protein
MVFALAGSHTFVINEKSVRLKNSGHEMNKKSASNTFSHR